MNEEITRKEFNELKELVEDSLDAAEENNRILKRMQAVGRMAFIGKLIIWTVVLVLPFFLLPLLAPYLKIMQLPGTNASSTSAGLFGLPSPEQLKEAMERYKSNM